MKHFHYYYNIIVVYHTFISNSDFSPSHFSQKKNLIETVNFDIMSRAVFYFHVIAYTIYGILLI
jgi:hypothetical protein